MVFIGFDWFFDENDFSDKLLRVTFSENAIFDRKRRFLARELGWALGKVKSLKWKKCRVISNCIKLFKQQDIPTIKNTTASRSLCGKIFVRKARIPPFAWRSSVNRSKILAPTNNQGIPMLG